MHAVLHNTADVTTSAASTRSTSSMLGCLKPLPLTHLHNWQQVVQLVQLVPCHLDQHPRAQACDGGGVDGGGASQDKLVCVQGVKGSYLVVRPNTSTHQPLRLILSCQSSTSQVVCLSLPHCHKYSRHFRSRQQTLDVLRSHPQTNNPNYALHGQAQGKEDCARFSQQLRQSNESQRQGFRRGLESSRF